MDGFRRAVSCAKLSDTLEASATGECCSVCVRLNLWRPNVPQPQIASLELMQNDYQVKPEKIRLRWFGHVHEWPKMFTEGVKNVVKSVGVREEEWED